MDYVSQSKLASIVGISEKTVRSIRDVALNYDTEIILVENGKKLASPTSIKKYKKIVEIRNNEEISFIDATHEFYTSHIKSENTEVGCRKCVQYEKEIERLSRLLRLSYKTI